MTYECQVCGATVPDRDRAVDHIEDEHRGYEAVLEWFFGDDISRTKPDDLQ